MDVTQDKPQNKPADSTAQDAEISALRAELAAAKAANAPAAPKAAAEVVDFLTEAEAKAAAEKLGGSVVHSGVAFHVEV
jgi:hypothetical protein